MPDDSTQHEGKSKFTSLGVILGSPLVWDRDDHALLIERMRQPREARKQLLFSKGMGSFVWVVAVSEIFREGSSQIAFLCSVSDVMR